MLTDRVLEPCKSFTEKLNEASHLSCCTGTYALPIAKAFGLARKEVPHWERWRLWNFGRLAFPPKILPVPSKGAWYASHLQISNLIHSSFV